MSFDEFVWIIGALCRVHRLPFDAALLAQQFPPPYDLAKLQSAAGGVGLKTGLTVSASPDFAKLSLPCAGFVRTGANDIDNADAAAKAVPATTPALLMKADGERLLYFLSGEQAPRTIALAAFADHFEPTLLLAARAAAPLADPDAVAQAGFGFAWFIPELLKHKGLWKEVLGASLFLQILALTTPVFTQVIVDKVVVHQTQSTLIVVAIALFCSLVFSAIMTWARQYLVLHTGNRIDAVLGARVWQHLLRLPPRYFDYRPTGTLVARMHGVETIREFITGAAITLLLDFPFLLVFLAVMFYYSWQLTLISLAIVTLLTGLSLAVVPLFRKRLNEQFLLGARNQAFMTEYIAGMETVKSLQMEPQLEQKFGEYLAAYLAATFNTKQVSNLYTVLANALEQIQTVAILCVGALIVMRNDGFTIGMLIAFQMFAARMAQPMMRLAGLWQEFQQASISVKRLGDVLDAATEPYSLVPARAAGGAGRIDIENLSFRYGPDRPFLYRDYSLAIEPGRCVALMGASGSGKSTLAKLLQAFYLPTEGVIRIDGRDTRSLSANELRQYFGVVPQDTILFAATVLENLTYANALAGFEDVVRCCKAAEIHDTIENLPQGYQTPIGEHGAGLSGGQKQRIAIARALLKRPRILIFDEATSSLDQATAEQFARTINQLKGSVTMLFIAHHLPGTLQVDETCTLA